MSGQISFAGASGPISQLLHNINERKKLAAQQETNSAKDIIELAQNTELLSLMLDMQSLRTDTTYAISAAQRFPGAVVQRDSSTQTVTASTAGEYDANNAEYLAGSAPNISTSLSPIPQSFNQSAAGSKTANNVGGPSSVDQANSRPAVKEKTDITAVESDRPNFINVVGSMTQLAVSNAIITTMLNAERDSNKSAAEAAIRSVQAAGRVGDKTIMAAKQNLNGAITSGVIGIAGQGATSASQMKALKKEGNSINKNLKPAHNLERGVREHQNLIKSSKDTMVHQNKKLASEVEATMSQPQSEDLYSTALMRDRHDKVQLVTQKVRVKSEYANQGIHSAQGVVNGGFGIASAEEQKQAELARADREVNNELTNTHSQTAKKAAETNAAIRNMTDKVLSTNSSTISSMAERTR